MIKDNKTIKTLQELECYTGLQQKYTIAIHNALYLINRQKEEIERLKNDIEEANIIERENEIQSTEENKENAKIFLQAIKQAKSEAIKEFAVMLKSGVPQETGVIRCVDVDNLVKEMTEVV